MVYTSRNISISIQAPFTDVYNFVANPENLPKWAAGLSKTEVKKEKDYWVADSPMGKVKIQFVDVNMFGVLDHDVTLPDGTVVHNPLRVMKNSDGSEVIFTLFKQPYMSDDAFEKDAKMVESDLAKLKLILEKN